MGIVAACVGVVAACVGVVGACVGTVAARVGTVAACVGTVAACVGTVATRVGTVATGQILAAMHGIRPAFGRFPILALLLLNRTVRDPLPHEDNHNGRWVQIR